MSLLERYDAVLTALVPGLQSRYGARLVSCALGAILEYHHSDRSI